MVTLISTWSVKWLGEKNLVREGLRENWGEVTLLRSFKKGNKETGQQLEEESAPGRGFVVVVVAVVYNILYIYLTGLK